MPDGLTNREWFLVREVQKRTLLDVLDGCKQGIPGRIVASQLLRLGLLDALRVSAEALVREYKPEAGAAGGAS